MSNKLVSVIVPVYKASKYIERCAETLLAQTYGEIEYYFVNDCTPDDSIEILNRVVSKYPERKVRIINLEKNMGHAHARNLALNICQGEYVIQIDADDWVEKNMIEKMLDSAIENDSDIVCSEFVWEKNNTVEYCHVNESDIYRDGLLNCKWTLEYSAHWNKLIRTSLIKDNGIYCIEGTNNWVDVGQVARLRFMANKISVVHEAMYHYNANNENSVSRHISDKRLNDMIFVAKTVSDFIESHTNGEYETSIGYLKFLAIAPMLATQRNEYQRWLETFPESKKHIMKYPLRTGSRILYWLAAHGIYLPLRIMKQLKGS